MGSETCLWIIRDESFHPWIPQSERNCKENRYEGVHHPPLWSSFSLTPLSETAYPACRILSLHQSGSVYDTLYLWN